MPSTQYDIYVRAVRMIGVNDEILEGNISIIVRATTLGKECVLLMIMITCTHNELNLSYQSYNTTLYSL